MSYSLRSLLVLSRPRFWWYEFGTFLVGVFAAYVAGEVLLDSAVLLYGFYFLIPANILIYGINDVYDYETDKLNPKKVAYEALLLPKYHPVVIRSIVLSTAPFLFGLFFIPVSAVVAFVLFLFFALQYSAYPIRAKARPVLDSVFSAGHYVMTGVFAFFLVGGEGFPWLAIVAGMAWAIAMHAYSAVPDIKADSKAGLQTIATWLGARNTLLLCAFLYAGATAIAVCMLHWWLIFPGFIYVGLMILSIQKINNHTALMRVYKWFPWINVLSGFLITLSLLLGNPAVQLFIQRF